MSNWTPSIVPTDDQTVYLVMDDFGKHGRAWRETDAEQIDLETIVTDLLEGQYSNPVRVVGFNTAHTACLMACLPCEGEGWVCENHPGPAVARSARLPVRRRGHAMPRLQPIDP